MSLTLKNEEELLMIQLEGGDDANKAKALLDARERERRFEWEMERERLKVKLAEISLEKMRLERGKLM